MAFRFLADVLELDRSVEFTIIRDRKNFSTIVSDERFEFESDTVVAQLLS